MFRSDFDAIELAKNLPDCENILFCVILNIVRRCCKTIYRNSGEQKPALSRSWGIGNCGNSTRIIAITPPNQAKNVSPAGSHCLTMISQHVEWGERTFVWRLDVCAAGLAMLSCPRAKQAWFGGRHRLIYWGSPIFIASNGFIVSNGSLGSNGRPLRLKESFVC